MSYDDYKKDHDQFFDNLEAERRSALLTQTKRDLGLSKEDTLALWKLDPEIEPGHDFVTSKSAKQFTALAVLCGPGVTVKLIDQQS